MTVLSTIKIFPEVYVGFQGRRGEDEVPLGFMTPYDKTAAGLSRQATVDDWTAGYSDVKAFNTVILKNVPMIGFKIGRSIRRSGSWGGNASYIRIEDPRGFELEISIENLAMCMKGNILEDGVLMQECVWGRDRGKNILLPTNSEPYMASLATTKKVSEVLSLKDIKPGDTIKLLTGEEAVYMGAMYGLVRHVGVPSNYGKNANKDVEAKIEVKPIKRYVIAVKQDDGSMVYVGHSGIKVSEIIRSAPVKLSPEEIEKEIFDAYRQNPKSISAVNNSWRDGYQVIVWITNPKNMNISSLEVEVTEPQASNNSGVSSYDSENCHVFVSSNSHTLVLDNRYNFGDMDRMKGGRSYRSGNKNYWLCRDVETTGWIGYQLAKGKGYVAPNSDLMHIEECDRTKLFMVETTITTDSQELKVWL